MKTAEGIPFHPEVAGWFLDRFGKPSPVQELAWPIISEGKHCLLTAPTGSGKTLAAFLTALDSFITGRYETGGVRVLYLSPLKALNHDIRLNLLGPLEELKARFESRGIPFPRINVMTRSGDTPEEERRLMRKTPPEILITTPESLMIMLTSPSGRLMLSGIQCVIEDEVHAVLDSRRGVLLSACVERLTLLCGEFQRIGISATVNPPATAALFVGGCDASGSPRPVELIRAPGDKRYELQVLFPDDGAAASHWQGVVGEAVRQIEAGGQTLFFTNSRRISEKAARLVNEEKDTLLAWSHHGALSREIRHAVEQRMKKGELPAIMATDSLELGIDIGELARVILLQPPWTLASAIQRIGRAGHGLGQTSRGIFLPLFRKDLLTAAACVKGIREGFLEETSLPEAPLDVLAQLILSLCAGETWPLEQLYVFVKRIPSYRELPREHFDLVAEMLAGRYSDSRIPELKPRVAINRISGTITARDGVPFLLYTSGGVIPDRGYFVLKESGTGVKIGELDEEFVWERQIGETFSLGTRLWKITRIGTSEVEVTAAEGALNIIPFWRADEMDRGSALSDKTADFLDRAEILLCSDAGTLERELADVYGFDERAACVMGEYLRLQRDTSGMPLPGRYRLVAEVVEGETAGQAQVILHTFWGGKVNRPFALALSAAWEESYGYPLQHFVHNDAVLFLFPHEFDPEALKGLLRPDNVDRMLSLSLASSGYFGGRFREIASNSLLLPRGAFYKRTPLWVNRLRSKKILEAVRKYGDFPVVLETWKSCLSDGFDLEPLREKLADLERGDTEWLTVRLKKPSPFCDGVIWREVNQFMYGDDTPLPARETGLSDELLRDLLAGSDLRRELTGELLDDYTRRLQRRLPGYWPETAAELADWMLERLTVTEGEWTEYLAALPEGEELSPLSEKVYLVPGRGVVHREIALSLHRFAGLGSNPGYRTLEGTAVPPDSLPAGLEPPEEDYFRQWGSFYACLSFDPSGNPPGYDSLLADPQRFLAEGYIREDFPGTGTRWFQPDNLESLIRQLRRRRREGIGSIGWQAFPSLLADWQGLSLRQGLEGLKRTLEQNLGYYLPAELWEEAVFPSRIAEYGTHRLDALFADSDLVWAGGEKQKILFSFREDLELFFTGSPGERFEGRLDWFDLKKLWNADTAVMTEKLWQGVFGGLFTADSYIPLRQGILQEFKPPESPAEGRGGFSRWKGSRPLGGYWHALPAPERDENTGTQAGDRLLEEGHIRLRIRQLLDRYGILCRPLLEKEQASFQWKRLLPVLRLMDLSGEILSGYFVEGFPMPQFCDPRALPLLSKKTDPDRVWWINALDPVSLCGLDTEWKKRLPERRPGNWVVFRGTELVLTVLSGGRELVFHGDPEGDWSPAFGFFRFLVTRDFRTLKKLAVETINGIPAGESPFSPELIKGGFRKSLKSLDFHKTWDYSR
jgi:ATP-dependent Lhr-like helicase